ncbi:unnamed protein product [Cylicocyclus nassatus]|uniref:Uncharacterized protein n=1 Tax=Cylicocyclus nassatus TaxID=53992 RepID=A0AA36H329_CYLNA|nr:unnamed protein product [Cylicocyclus nassatus]
MDRARIRNPIVHMRCPFAITFGIVVRSCHREAAAANIGEDDVDEEFGEKSDEKEHEDENRRVSWYRGSKTRKTVPNTLKIMNAPITVPAKRMAQNETTQ